MTGYKDKSKKKSKKIQTPKDHWASGSVRQATVLRFRDDPMLCRLSLASVCDTLMNAWDKSDDDTRKQALSEMPNNDRSQT